MSAKQLKHSLTSDDMSEAYTGGCAAQFDKMPPR